MIRKICPKCSHVNELSITMDVEDYVCSKCNSAIDTENNKSEKILTQNKYPLSLNVGQMGVIENTEYIVVAIVVRKTDDGYKWAEYFLKDQQLNDAFLSESQGHWILLKPMKEAFESEKKITMYKGFAYRKYEVSNSTVSEAFGFFEDGLNFGKSTYIEYVNKEKILSCEHLGKHSYYYDGRHFSLSELKLSFSDISYISHKTGYGIVQPFFIDTRQLINIFGVTLILISLVQIFIFFTRKNKEVFGQNIRFDAVRKEDYISTSFELYGASAPLQVKLFSDVDNSWASVDLGLVNEKTNETFYASKDIEQYHGYEGGESWSEGSKDADFNYCGVAPGKYHFTISAQKQGYEKTTQEVYYSPDVSKYFEVKGNETVEVTILVTNEKVSYNLADLDKVNPQLAKELSEVREDFVNNTVYPAETGSNTDVQITAIWKPVTLWNYMIILVSFILLGVLCYWGEHYFEKAKWYNSDFSPYDYE